MLTLILLVATIVGLLVLMRREAGAVPILILFGVLGLAGLLLEAARRLKDELPDMHFVLIGEGAAKAELEKIVQRYARVMEIRVEQ